MKKHLILIAILGCSLFTVQAQITGCITSYACNFDPSATIDDGSCLYYTTGCMDVLASNYDPTAGCAGPCTYADTDGDMVIDPLEVPGCTNPSASNYDPSATEDVGLVDLSFSSTVTNLYSGPPAGIANGSTFTFTASFALDDAFIDPSFTEGDECDFFPDVQGCNYTAWTFSTPVSCTVNYSSGYSEVGQFNHIVIIDGGFEDFGNGILNDGQDNFIFYNGNQKLYEIRNVYGGDHNGAASNLYYELARLETIGLNIGFYWHNGFEWGTYLYDYISSPNYTVADVTFTSECEILGCIDSIACNFDSIANIDDGSCAYAIAWYADEDDDGFGDSGNILMSCNQPMGYTDDDTDCDDLDSTVYPGAPELCDGKDNDCDGIVPDEEIDNDGDGFSECEGDCNDLDATMYTGAPELCDGKDNDCDGEIDEGMLDNDADGLCDALDDDDDNDGISDTDELDIYGSDPLDDDSDDDGLSDGEEVLLHGSNPIIQDSDGDGLTDNLEVNVSFTSPINIDTNGDGCTDDLEFSQMCPSSDPCANDCPQDINSDGEINTSDLLELLGAYGLSCP